MENNQGILAGATYPMQLEPSKLHMQMRSIMISNRVNKGFDSSYAMNKWTFIDARKNYLEMREVLINLGYSYTETNDSAIFYKKCFNDIMISCISISIFKQGLTAYFNGDSVEIKYVSSILSKTFIDTHIKVTIASMTQKGNITYSSKVVGQDKTQDPHQSFYPSLKLPLQEYYSKFMSSKENVLVLIGPPGTGKSTFLRGLITIGKNQTLLVYENAAAKSPELIETFYDTSAKVLAFEDSDNLITARSLGNDLMTSFLNASEGIVACRDKKIVFSTNLPSIDKIDPALLRRGRCFDIIKFEKLTVDQARLVEQDMELEPQEFDSNKKYTLSEILNPIDKTRQMAMREREAIGFSV